MDEEVYERPLAMKLVEVPTYPEERDLAPSWAAGVTRRGINQENGSNRGGWMYNRWWPGRENGNPGRRGDRASQFARFCGVPSGFRGEPTEADRAEVGLQKSVLVRKLSSFSTRREAVTKARARAFAQGEVL